MQKRSAQDLINSGSAPSWRQFLGWPEFWSLVVGVACAVLAVLMIWVARKANPAHGNALMKVLTIHVIMGAPIGAAEAAKYPILEYWENVVFNTLITTTIITFFNALFGLSCRRFFRLHFLHRTFQDLQGDAHRQKKTWAKFGIPGIFFFVFVPLTGTGPVIGSLLARFVGLRYWGALLTVISGSICSIAAWGYAADKLQQYLGDRVLGVILWVIILGTFLMAGVAKIVSWRKRRREAREKSSGAEPAPQEQKDRYYYDAVHDDASKTYHSFPQDDV